MAGAFTVTGLTADVMSFDDADPNTDPVVALTPQAGVELIVFIFSR